LLIYGFWSSSLYSFLFFFNIFFMWWQMIIVTWYVSLTKMSSCIVMSSQKVFIKKKKRQKKEIVGLLVFDSIPVFCFHMFYFTLKVIIIFYSYEAQKILLPLHIILFLSLGFKLQIHVCWDQMEMMTMLLLGFNLIP